MVFEGNFTRDKELLTHTGMFLGTDLSSGKLQGKLFAFGSTD